MLKALFSSKGVRATELLALVHGEVSEPMSSQARGGYEYFVTFTDVASRYGYMYRMKHQSETFDKFKEFRQDIEKQTGKSIKTLRSDRGE